MQCTSHVPNLHGHRIRTTHQGRTCCRIPGQHSDLRRHYHGAITLDTQSISTTGQIGPLPATRQVFLQSNLGGIPRFNYLRRRTTYGSSKAQSS